MGHPFSEFNDYYLPRRSRSPTLTRDDVFRDGVSTVHQNFLLRMPVCRLLAYLWASPNSAIGVTVGLLLGGKMKWVEGVLEIHSPALAFALHRMPVPAAAMTLGHVVLGQSPKDLARTRAHERVHVRQFERWGPFFLLAYGACSLWLLIQRRDAYQENPFEVEAFAMDDPTRRVPESEAGGS